MLEIIINGLFIGFLTSAPMGPVGMLCIQRTLNDGRKSGLITGFGAATGDMIIAFFAMIAALGLGFSTEFIQAHKWPLQIIGSIVLIAFGAAVSRKNPSHSISSNLKENKASDWKLFVTSMLLTISNIATLFLFIALFARFNVINAANPFGYDLLGILFIGLGAVLWWITITYLVNKLRGAFNPRGLKLFNKIVGIILMLIGAIGIFTAFTSVALLG